MFLSLKLSLKFNRGLSRNVLISLTSQIIFFSIIIGIFSSLISLSIINGFMYELNRRILNIVPHIEIKATSNKNLINWEKKIQFIQEIPGIISVSPYIDFSGLIEHHDKWKIIQIRGIDSKKSIDRLYNFTKNQDYLNFSENKKQIIIGKGLSDVLKINKNDQISITINHDLSSLIFNTFSSAKKISLEVFNILNLHGQLDHNLALIPLLDAQNYCNKRFNIDGIIIYIDNIFYVNQFIKKICKIFTDNVSIRSWKDTYGYIYRDIKMIQSIVYISMVLVMSIASINIIIMIILSIKEKKYDIAILKAIGAKTSLVKYIFFWNGFLISLIAGIIGSILGVLVSSNLIVLEKKIFCLFKFSVIPENVYFINFIPVYLKIQDVIMVFFLELLVGSFVSWKTISRVSKSENLFKLLK